MNNLNNKIVEILKKHPEGGEKFFDALGLKIRSDTNILNDYISWVKSYYGYNACIGVIVTGFLEESLQAINPKVQILKAFVVYDGSKERSEKVLGMYRYYSNKDGHSS